MNKRSMIVALTGLNLLLLAGLLISRASLPAAMAQSGPDAARYLAVTCEVDQGYEALYLVDLSERRLHAYVPPRHQRGRMTYRGSTSLEDLRRLRAGP